MSLKDVKCELCGTTFATPQEKEEHKKLEHKENLGPSGVS
jgi:ribosomal protein S27E